MNGFANETEIINVYTQSQAQNPILSAIAVIFKQYDQPTIKYKLRHSWKIPNSLYQSLASESVTSSTSMYFEMMPFIQVQICLDEAFIKQVAPDSNVKVCVKKNI